MRYTLVFFLSTHMGYYNENKVADIKEFIQKILKIRS